MKNNPVSNRKCGRPSRDNNPIYVCGVIHTLQLIKTAYGLSDQKLELEFGVGKESDGRQWRRFRTGHIAHSTYARIVHAAVRGGKILNSPIIASTLNPLHKLNYHRGPKIEKNRPGRPALTAAQLASKQTQTAIEATLKEVASPGALAGLSGFKTENTKEGAAILLFSRIAWNLALTESELSAVLKSLNDPFTPQWNATDEGINQVDMDLARRSLGRSRASNSTAAAAARR